MLALRLICKKRLSFKLQSFIWYAGLIRGAIAYALTYRIDRTLLAKGEDMALIRQNTLLIVVISTVVFGSMMTLFAKLLGISVEKQSVDDQVFKRFRQVSVTSLDEILAPENRLSFDKQLVEHQPLSKTHHYMRSFDNLPPIKIRSNMHNAWKQFDEKYLKKYLGGE